MRRAPARSCTRSGRRTAPWSSLALGLILVALGGHGAAASAKETAPKWLADAAALPVPAYDPKVPAVVLHDEEILSLDTTGRVQGIHRYAVRILRYEGRKHATAKRHYRTDGGSIRELRAWMIKAQGQVTAYGKKDAVDAAAVGNDVYNEERIRGIDASDDADVGTVFGFEASFGDRQFSGQFAWSFQGELPTLRSGLSLEVPPEWSVKSVTFNHTDIPAAVLGSTYTWELRDLPWIEDEPARPPVTSLAPRIAVDASCPRGPSQSQLVSFESWSQVARWLDGLAAPSSAPNAAIAAKAQSLAARASTPLDRIRPIAQYVQSLNYIAIQIGVSRGEGYRPHPASDVFAKAYGDCKDKANLMKTMLACVGIESYLVLIRAEDPAYVREEWPSPDPFDHCIVAVRAGSESSAAVAKHPTLGPLLFFDPTDPETPLGDLPAHEQGGWALLVTKDGGGLIRAPVTPPETNRMERVIEAELDSTGAVRGTIHEHSRGQEATEERRLFHGASQAKYLEVVERWVAQGATNATVSGIAPRDDARGDRFELTLDFIAQGYAQTMDRRLMIFKPAIVGRNEWLSFTQPSRKYPVLLEGWAYEETTGTKLPTGFGVEELPKPVRLETTFGSYTAGMEEKGGTLIFTRSLRLKAMAVPTEQYDSLRRFFERVRSTELTPVVLSRR